VLTTFTIRCDWPGCTATLTAETPVAITKARWTKETDSLAYSLHLCPAHKRHDWFDVRLATFKALGAGHSTPGPICPRPACG